MADKAPNVDSLFMAALEIDSPEQRMTFLRQSCGDNKELLAELTAMMSAQGEIGSFLEQPAPGLEDTFVSDASGKDLAASLDAGLALSFDGKAAVVIGDANHSVLRSLGNTLHEVPRVSLRESEAEGDDPISRPNSPEVPQSDSDSRYRLDGEIARGGMGAIIKGRDTDLGRDLAIKVLLDSHKDKPEVIQRFVEEAQIGGQLQHPGIAPIYELGQFKDKRPFFAMKLVKGQTLSKLLADREDAVDERGKLIGIFEQICQTMAYAHSRGVIHRDLKPANIMVGAFGEVQVMDWGLAKVLQVGGVADEKKSQTLQQGQSIIQTMRSGVGSDSPGTFGSFGSETQMGSVMGTPAYMPPEQALGEIDQMDERADVFGLGAILCEILTGKPPYVAEDGTRVFRMASRGKLDDAFSRLETCGADEDLIALTKRCLELEPVDRPRDAGVLAERVTGYLESVEEKLREAEVQRAAEAARADAESAQANAERQRAEAQSQRAEAQSARAEAESARASEESKRRRTSLALAASVLLLVGFGSGGWLYMERQEANRGRQEAVRQAQLAAERTERAEAMELLAEQRDVQRKAAEQAEATAVTARQDAEREREVAVEAKSIAESAEEEGRRLLYATDMQLVDALLKDDESSARQILSRLNAHDPDRPDNPNPGEDLRSFEWHYFKSVLEKRSTIFDGFDQPVVGSALTEEGELVTLDNSAQLRRFDATTRIETRPPLDLRQGRQLGLKALSADGRMAALVESNQVHLVDTTTGADLVPAIETLGRYGVIFSTDAAMLITVDAKITWWDTATGKQLAMADSLLEYKAAVPASVSANGLTVAVGKQGGSAHAWSAFRMDPDSKKITVLQDKIKKDGSMRTLAVTPDGKLVATAALLSSHLTFYDIVSGELVGRSQFEHASSIATIGFRPESHEMVTGSIDGVLKYCKDYRQLQSNEILDEPETRSLQGHDKSITQAVIAADGKRIISSSVDQTTRIWNVQPQSVSLAQPVSALNSHRSVYSPDGLLIVGGGGDGEIRVCEAATGRLVCSFDTGATDTLYAVAVSPDNRLLAVSRGGQQPELRDLASGQRRSVLPRAKLGDGGTMNVSTLMFSPNGKHLVAASGLFDHYMNQSYESDVLPLVVYDVATGRLDRDLRGHRNSVMNVAFSRDGKLLASASHDRTARIWDTETWQTIHVLNNPDKSDGTMGSLNGVADVAFSPDGTRLAMASHAGNVHIFDTQFGAFMETLRGHAGIVEAVRFSPDGRTLVSCGADGTTRLWNAATWRQITKLDCGLSSFRPVSLRFSPDGRQLLAAGRQNVFWSTLPGALSQAEQLASNLKPLLESKSLFRNRIRLLSENGQMREALELLDPKQPLVQAALAATRADRYASLERWPEAAAEFAVLQKLDPSASHTWLRSPGLLRLARALLVQNQPALASELIAVASLQMQTDGITRSNRIGIQYVPNRHPVQLTAVSVNSPAERAGLRVGDVISQVNDVELTADNANQFGSLLAGEPGTRLRLTVQHAGSDEPQQIELIKELVYSDPQFGSLLAAMQPDVDERLADNDDDPDLRLLRAELLGLRGDVPAQIGDYTAVIETLAKRTQHEAPDNKATAQLAELYRRRGDAYLDQMQWQPAVDDYARAITDQTTDQDLLANQASALANVLLADADETATQIKDPWTRLAVAYALQGQTDRAVETFGRALSQTDSEDVKQAAFAQAAKFEQLLIQLADLHPPDEPLVQLTLAKLFVESGNKAFAEQRPAEKLTNRARQILKGMLDADPENSTVARMLTDLLLEIEDQLHWTILRPLPREMKSEGGATLKLLKDGSILASGENPDHDAYTITAKLPMRRVTAIRLEAIPHPSLPKDGPGRFAGDGNFHLNEFRVLINETPQRLDRILISYDEVKRLQDLDQHHKVIDGVIDDEQWSIYPRSGQRHWAVVLTDLDLATSDSLTMELVTSRGKYAQHNLGRFRLSVSDELRALENARTHFAAQEISDPWMRLAAAYHQRGDQQAVDQLLKQHPQAMVGIVDLAAAAGDWPHAIEGYSELITDQTSDATLLSRRAAAYVATEQWELALADCLRVNKQQPDLLKQAIDDSWLQYRALPLAAKLVLAEKLDAYRAFCKLIAMRFGETTNATFATYALKACLLQPGILDVSRLPVDAFVKQFEKGASTQGGPGQARWGLRGLLALRSGDPERAVEYVEQSVEFGHWRYFDAYNWSVLAMAQFELDRPDEAQSALAEASRIIAKGGNDDNHDYLIAKILFREAEAKINGKTHSADASSTPPEKPATTPAGEQPKATPDESGNGEGN